MLLFHDQALEQAQYALHITSRGTEANERSQRELVKVHAKLEARVSELAAVCLRLMDAEDGWAKSKAEADTLHAGTQDAASFVHMDVDRDRGKLIVSQRGMSWVFQLECDPFEFYSCAPYGYGTPRITVCTSYTMFVCVLCIRF